MRRLPAPFASLVAAIATATASVAGAVACNRSAATGVVEVSGATQGAFETALVPFGDGFAAGWYDTRDGNAEIYMRRLDARGAPVDVEHRLTYSPEQSYEVSLAALGDRLVAAWYDKAPSGELTARLAMFTPDGNAVWERPLRPGTRNPVVRTDGRRIFCAWIERVRGNVDAGAADGSPDAGDFVWGGWWDDSGRQLAPPMQLGRSGRTTYNLNAFVEPAGTAWVAFDAQAGTRVNELFLARLSDRADVYQLSSDDGHKSVYPDVAIVDGRLAVTWWDEKDGNSEVYLAVVPLDQLAAPGSAERLARRITDTPEESIGAYLAVGRDTIGVAWCDKSEGQHEVYVQPFDRTGAPVSSPRRLTRTSAASLIPAIAARGDGFGILWNEYRAEAAEGHAAVSQSRAYFARLMIGDF